MEVDESSPHANRIATSGINRGFWFEIKQFDIHAIGHHFE